jgi:hypothetical protein
MKRSKTPIKRSKKPRNGQKRSGTVRHGQEHLGTFKSERSKALERIFEKSHGTFTFTHQKRKNYCIKIVFFT